MTARKVLGRNALGQRKFRIHEHPVPEWDGVVLLRRITEGELTSLQETAKRVAGVNGKEGVTAGTNPKEMSRFRRSLVYTCWVDEQNEQVLTNLNDLDVLAGEEFSIINGIAEAAAKHCGLTDDAAKDAEKNSAPILNGASGSDLPLN